MSDSAWMCPGRSPDTRAATVTTAPDAGLLQEARPSCRQRRPRAATCDRQEAGGKFARVQVRNVTSRQRRHSDRRPRGRLLQEAGASRGQIGCGATAREGQRAGVDVSRRMVVRREVAGHKRVPRRKRGDRAVPGLPQELPGGRSSGPPGAPMLACCWPRAGRPGPATPPPCPDASRRGGCGSSRRQQRHGHVHPVVAESSANESVTFAPWIRFSARRLPTGVPLFWIVNGSEPETISLATWVWAGRSPATSAAPAVTRPF